MAYPTGILSLSLEQLDRLAVQTKSLAEASKASMEAGNVTSSQILRLHLEMLSADSQMAAIAAVPGIVQYAKDQKNDQALDVIAEFQAMRAAVQGVAAAIVTAFPTSGIYLLAVSFDAQGTVDRQFTPAQTAGIRTTLDAVVASIS